MIFQQAAPEHIHHVALNMRPKDFEEISCTSWEEDRAGVAASLTGILANHENVYCLGTVADGPICILAYVPIHKGVWRAGMFASKKFPRIALSATRIIIRKVIPALSGAGVHRLEVRSLATYTTVHRWLEFIGLRRESYITGYGRNGEDFIDFVFTRHSSGPPMSLRWQSAGVIE